MHGELKIEPARMADIETIEALHERALLGLCDGFYRRREILSFLRFVGTFDPQLVHDGTYYVARDARGIVGCAGWSFRSPWTAAQRSGGEAPRLDPARHPAFLRGPFVDPEHARRGIGTLLALRSEVAAASAGFARFQIVASRLSEGLYLNLGYRRLADCDVTLPDGTRIALVRMVRRLVQPGFARPQALQSAA